MVHFSTHECRYLPFIVFAIVLLDLGFIMVAGKRGDYDGVMA